MAEDDDRGFQKPSSARSDGVTWSALSAASRDTADAFLREQIGILKLEKEKLEKEDAALDSEIALNLSHLRLRRFSDYARVALELAGFLVVLLIVSALGTMVWWAAQDRDLVVDAFSVPPDMAQTGMTGAALANRVLDRFGDMDRHVLSFTQDFSAYHGSAKDDVRVEIPETGISLADLNRYLRAWLGHETHVTGELVRTKKGLALTVRYGDNPGLTAEGDDLDKLIQQSAENVFRAVHPLRFADYISSHGRPAEAEGIALAEAQKGDNAYRSQAYISLGFADLWRGDNRKLGVDGAKAVALDPKSPVAWFIEEASANNLSHEEEDLKTSRGFVAAVRGDSDTSGGDFGRSAPIELEADTLGDLGDFEGQWQACQRLPEGRRIGACNIGNSIAAAASLHEYTRGRSLAHSVPAASQRGAVDLLFSEVQLEQVAGNWTELLVLAKKGEAAVGVDGYSIADRNTFLRPFEAEALARTGNMKAALAMAAALADDCDVCLRQRGRVAAVAHDWSGAAHWFSLVAARSPDIPFANTEWGRMLMMKGDFDGAIAKFKEANAEGPHYADPLEMWGEALMQENRSDLALAKFEEANKYAPNWGRLHLKWGEALYYAGRKDDAKIQFVQAAGLELAADDRFALARFMR